jgi:hypothetical protein
VGRWGQGLDRLFNQDRDTHSGPHHPW